MAPRVSSDKTKPEMPLWMSILFLTFPNEAAFFEEEKEISLNLALLKWFYLNENNWHRFSGVIILLAWNSEAPK